MKAKELIDLSDDELQERYDDLVKESFDLKQEQVSGKMEKPLRLRFVRRDIARLKTVMNQRRKKS